MKTWDELRNRRKRIKTILNQKLLGSLNSNNKKRFIRAGWNQWRIWFASSLKPVGDKFLHAMKTCVELRDKTGNKKLQAACDKVIDKLRMLLTPKVTAADRQKNGY